MFNSFSYHEGKVNTSPIPAFLSMSEIALLLRV